MSPQGGEKRHPPTERRLQELRRRGQWYSSSEVSSAASLVVFALIWSSGLGLFPARLIEVAHVAWSTDRIASSDPLHALGEASTAARRTLFLLAAIFLFALSTVAALSRFLQVGPMFAVNHLWNLPKMNPFKSFRSIFLSRKSYQRAAMNLLKAALMTALVVLTCWRSAPEFILSSRLGVMATAQLFAGRFGIFLWQAVGLFGVFGLADYMIQRQQFLKDNWMTDEDMKEEQKEERGNLEAKMRMRNEQRRQQNAASAQKEAGKNDPAGAV